MSRTDIDLDRCAVNGCLREPCIRDANGAYCSAHALEKHVNEKAKRLQRKPHG